MAYVTDWTCRKCRKPQYSAVPRDYTCSACEMEKKDRDRREYFGRIDALTVEERLREVEEWIYEHKQKYHARRNPTF